MAVARDVRFQLTYLLICALVAFFVVLFEPLRREGLEFKGVAPVKQEIIGFAFFLFFDKIYVSYKISVLLTFFLKLLVSLPQTLLQLCDFCLKRVLSFGLLL